MKIICASLSKTGTTSLAAALKILGFTVHDFAEHLQHHMDEYLQAFDNNMPDFTAMYSSVDAITDFPACFFWKDINECFPAAKVILMERDDVESWVQSILQCQGAWEFQIRSLVWFRFGLNLTSTGRKWKRISKHFEARYKVFENENKIGRIYTEHNSRVKASIPRGQLLVYNVKQEWIPLCKFLKVDVPDVPFPRLNVKSEGMQDAIIHSAAGKRVFLELIFLVTIFFTLTAAVWAYKYT